MNLLIVDDEPAIILIIRKAINWEYTEIDRVFSANNISRAKDIFNEHTIDILLCDIEMSQENGLDLLRWVNGQPGITEKLLLTSHKNFDYAQSAISLDVSEYILKPVSYKQLQEILKAAGQRVRERRRKKHLELYGEYVENQKNPIQSFFELLIREDVFSVPGQIEEVIGKQQLPISPQSVYTLVYFSGTDRRYIEDLGRRSYFYLQNIAAELCPEASTVSVEKDILFIMSNQLTEGRLQAVCRNYMQKIQEILKYNISAYIARGVDLVSFSKTTDELICMSQYYHSLPQEIFYHEDYDLMEPVPMSILPSAAAVSSSDTTAVASVKKYIWDHLGESITREQLSGLAHLNKDYLNRLFKRYTGYSIIQYIQLCRIDRAKRLLSEGQKSITEVSIECGFNSPAHFTKIFLRLTGVSPKQYMAETAGKKKQDAT